MARISKLQLGLCVLQLLVICFLGVSLFFHPTSGQRVAATRSAVRARVAASAVQGEGGPRGASVFNPECQGEAPPPYYLADIAVSSVCDSRGRRDSIRKGWGSVARSLGFRVQFFIGQPSPEDLHCAASLPAEAELEGDLVILPLVESYENLTQKVLGMMAYVGRCGRGRFYAKCDDDVFVYANQLKKRMTDLLDDSKLWEYSLGPYVGNFWIDGKPITEPSNKNYEGNWRGSTFPPYAAGPFYLLSRQAVEYVYRNARNMNWRWRNEDMAVGTWMSGLDIKIVEDYHVKVLNWKHYERPFIAEHALDYWPDSVEHWLDVHHKNFSMIAAV